jgi:hypothetical protein
MCRELLISIFDCNLITKSPETSLYSYRYLQLRKHFLWRNIFLLSDELSDCKQVPINI